MTSQPGHSSPAPASRNPWWWVPTLYFGEGLPYTVVMSVSIVMYKRLGLSNADIALATSLFGIPWAVKPLWGPVVDMVSTRRNWILWTQALFGVALLLLSGALHLPAFVALSFGLFVLLAFTSATHDIAADGFYMLGLSDHHQAGFVGVRSTFYRVAWLSGQGLFVILAGYLEMHSGGGIPLAWSQTFAVIAAVFFVLFLYHRRALPVPPSDRPSAERTTPGGMLRVFGSFFRRKGIGKVLLFLLFYRVAESQLVKMVQPFLLDPREKGGLGLSTSDVGLVYGTIGMIAFVAGGLIGGYVVSRGGLRFWLWPMVLVIHVPDAVFVYLSHAQPDNLAVISASVAAEQFGYGFGFTAYALYMIIAAGDEHRTSYFALCTGIMALGQMLPGAVSGWIQQLLGYKHFFIWVVLWTIPGFIVAALAEIPEGYGKRKEA
jgi:MFS transporter, PAT family, beta-lactamase induction signal transducer AmpG